MWDEIELINWDTRWEEAVAYESAKQFILDSYSESKCRQITKFAYEQHDKLTKRVEEYERIKHHSCGHYNGVDTFNDMIAQVIGLGKKTYDKVFENPNELKFILYGESFLYCLPHDEDFELRAQTNECVLELNRIVTETGNNAVIADLMQRCRLILSGDFKTAVTGFTGELYNDMRFFTGNDCNAKFANLIRDCNKFYVSY